MDWTSVPRWGPAAPAVDPTGTAHALVSVGAEAVPVAEGWAAGLAGRPVRRHHADVLDEAFLAGFRAELAAARVGWRLLLCGPEADVLLLRAEAVAAGAIPAEIRAHATSARRRRVRCAHCRSVTVTDAGVGGTAACGGCGRGITVHHHHSRRLAAYLGFEADLGEPS